MTNTSILSHPEWGDYDPDDPMSEYRLNTPMGDLSYALHHFTAITAETQPREDGRRLSLDDVAVIHDAYASYERTAWAPGQPTGTELELVVVAQLRSGEWVSVEAWNDYTGWGCRDDATVSIGPDRESVYTHGLTESGRRMLDLPLLGEEGSS